MKKLLILSLFGLFYSTAYAVDVTNGPLQQHPALCNYGYNPNCGQNNEAAPPPKKVIRHITVDVPSKYGALALNEKVGHIAGALNKSSKSEAMQGAKIQCEQGTKGKPCKVITWVRNGCVAAAAGTLKGKAIITKAAEKPGKAEEVALNRCRASGAKTCEIIMPEGCSIPEGMYQ